MAKSAGGVPSGLPWLKNHQTQHDAQRLKVWTGRSDDYAGHALAGLHALLERSEDAQARFGEIRDAYLLNGAPDIDRRRATLARWRDDHAGEYLRRYTQRLAQRLPDTADDALDGMLDALPGDLREELTAPLHDENWVLQLVAWRDRFLPGAGDRALRYLGQLLYATTNRAEVRGFVECGRGHEVLRYGMEGGKPTGEHARDRVKHLRALLHGQGMTAKAIKDVFAQAGVWADIVLCHEGSATLALADRPSYRGYGHRRIKTIMATFNRAVGLPFKPGPRPYAGPVSRVSPTDW